ncbi:hypothetical protein PIB30_066365 [Stylosanthes scabra]|uniref:Uncharacterized protein n=1 Tax=Stylosanthes scabra TaxID=79078 RepID=A0ABU6ZL04_9FABA|nr:hypothetical protein [Stylosanthes scabra]
MKFRGYYSDSEEEFEGNYEISEPNEEDPAEYEIESDVEDVANALANELPFQESSSMNVLDIDALNAREFAKDMISGPSIVRDDEFAIGMELTSVHGWKTCHKIGLFPTIS